MTKWVYAFFKLGKNNSYLFSISLYFLKLFPKNNDQIVLEIFKNKFLFLKIENRFKITWPNKL